MLKLKLCRPVLPISILAGIIITANCAAKKQWQGTHITVSHSKIMPKEDFKVLSYIIVAYDILAANKYSHVAYHFDIFQDNKKVGALEVCDRSQEDARLSLVQANSEYKYYLVAGDEESVRKQTMGLRTAYQIIHKAYKEIPGYEDVKSDVKEVINKM